MPQAIVLLEKARAAQPANAQLTASLGDLYIRWASRRRRWRWRQDQAAANSIDLLSMKAAAQIALDQKGDARDTYGQILKVDPTALGARQALGNLLCRPATTNVRETSSRKAWSAARATTSSTRTT